MPFFGENKRSNMSVLILPSMLQDVKAYNRTVNAINRLFSVLSSSFFFFLLSVLCACCFLVCSHRTVPGF